MNGEEEEEEEEVVLRGGPKHIQCTEDEDFLADFERMMSETVMVCTDTWWLLKALID